MWLFLFLGLAFADEVTVDVPVVDAPFNFLDGSYMAPSMRQSLAVSSAFYETIHRAIMGSREDGPPAVWRQLAVIGFDVISTYLPGGDSWLHEEWHRAVMSRRGISSFNDVYNFPVGESSIAVSHVTDEGLIGLKADHPAEQVRLSAAGMESQVAQNIYIQRHQFFNGAPANNQALFWLNNFSVIGYLATCASKEADRFTDEANIEDGADVAKRDFTGLDCTAWVYDLFRPDEAYTARGVHPSGIGVDRYIRYSDLTDEERNFLKRQVPLSALNLVDPFLIGWGGSRGKTGRLSHNLTSFGYTVDAHLLVKGERHQFHFRLHNGFNNKTYFPGLTVEWLDYKIPDSPWLLTLSLTLWNQPRAQRFDAKGGALLLAGSAEVAYGWSESAKVYLGVEAKTPGWMTGREFLDRSVVAWTGLRAQVF